MYGGGGSHPHNHPNNNNNNNPGDHHQHQQQQHSQTGMNGIPPLYQPPYGNSNSNGHEGSGYPPWNSYQPNQNHNHSNHDGGYPPPHQNGHQHPQHQQQQPQPWYIPTGPQGSSSAGPSSEGHSQHHSPYIPGATFPRGGGGNIPPPNSGSGGGGLGVTNGTGAYPTPGNRSTPEQADGKSSGPTSGTPVTGTTATKRKRKKTSVVDGSTSPGGDAEKRTKTGRACDACRTKKIRCDILPASESHTEDQPICAHCKHYNLECTFFLPITETRFKKKKQREEGDPVPVPIPQHEPKPPPEVPSRFEGPSSINYLLHTTLPASTSEAFDLRHHHSWEVSEDGNGLIRVNAPPSASGYADADPEDPTKAHNRLNKPVLSAQTISLLVNAYFEGPATLFPIISRTEFAAKQNPSPLLLYAICGLGATRRGFPREVFSGVRGVINGLLRSNDILSDARFEHVQALLLLSQVGDLHAQPTAATASASLIRMGTATRMAQDLGLHRESNLRAQTAQDLAYVELRRRIWATCVILDRWYGAALGIPLLIDLLDCDVLLPAPYEIVPDSDPSTWPIDPSFMALSEHLKLSILVGRVLKSIYSPTGLKHATDSQLEALLTDMQSWKENLAEELQFKGNDSNPMAGLLHLSYAALHFLLWRVFMRITYNLPSHLSFHLTPANWSAMQKWSEEGIEWLSHHDDALDTLFIFPYAATSCALVQYHSWARRRDARALESLRLVRETALRWEQAVQPDQMSIRRKTCETMTLLYEAALKTSDEVSSRPKAVNPIPGVTNRSAFGKAVWVPDTNHEAGGVWIAQSQQELDDSGLQPNGGGVLLASDYEKSMGIRPSTGTSASVATGPTPSGNDPNSAPRGTTLSVSQSPQLANIGGTPLLDDRNLPTSNAGGQQPTIEQISQSQDHYPLENPSAPPLHQPQQQQQQQQSQQGGPPGEVSVLHGMQMAADNVNPQLNFGFDANGNIVQGLDFHDPLIPVPDPNNPPNNFDLNFLDGLPANGFNFDQWNSWFESIDRLVPPGTGPAGPAVPGISGAGLGPGSAPEGLGQPTGAEENTGQK